MIQMAMDRRSLMRAALVLVGVSVIGNVAACTPRGEAETYFSSKRRAILDDIADLMIPETDTPGAKSVEVPAYIDRMMAQWAADQTRADMDKLFDDFNAAAKSAQGKDYLELTPAQRLAHLTSFDAANIADLRGAYARMKELILTAYYLSEPGATQELRFDPVPGPMQADIPASDVERAWAV